MLAESAVSARPRRSAGSKPAERQDCCLQEMAREEGDGAVYFEAGDFLVGAGVGVEALLFGGEGVEQCQARLAGDVLVVPLEGELDRDGDLAGEAGQHLVVPEDAEGGRGDSRVG